MGGKEKKEKKKASLKNPSSSAKREKKEGPLHMRPKGGRKEAIKRGDQNR